MRYFRSVISSNILLLILLVLALVLFSQEYVNKSEPVGVALEILWPLPDSNLTSAQVLSVSVPGLQPGQLARYKLFWELENGTLGGEMNFDGQNTFTTSVDTNTWDWKRDNHYKLTFLVRDQNGEIKRREEVAVFVGNAGIPSVALNEPVEDPTPEIETMGENSANVYSSVTPKTTTKINEIKAPTTPVVPTFSVDLVKALAKQDQKFVIKFSGYDNSKTGVFWKVDDGKKNPIYNDGSGFVASINIYGWNWRGEGPYPVTIGLMDIQTSKVLVTKEFVFTRKGEGEVAVVAHEVKTLATATTNEPVWTAPVVTTSSSSTATTTSKPNPVSANKPQSAKVTLPVTNYSPLKVGSLYIPKKPAILSAIEVSKNSDEKTALEHITKQSSAIWLNGDGIDNNIYIQNIITESKSQSRLPVFVLYNIPDRDCGAYSSGGAKASADYRAWVDRLATHLTGEAIVIVEPDAIPQLNCVSKERQDERLALIKYAVDKLSSSNSKLHIYLDAGHAFWVNAEEMATRLERAGIKNARGFALNVSNFVQTINNVTYGYYLSNLLSGKNFVIDTSRNGKGPTANREWCNPRERGLGENPVIFGGSKGKLDAYLWIKIPGESDGTCNGGPGAGGFWPEYATELYRNRI